MQQEPGIDRDQLQRCGYAVHQGDAEMGELNGRWWWSLYREGWGEVEPAADDWATEEEAWRGAQTALEQEGATEALLASLVAGRREDGKVLVHESGRDCDGVDYAGWIHAIEPTLEAFLDLDARTYRNADGPFKLSILGATDDVPGRYTRDLTMEAFENGHPYVLRPGAVYASAPADADELPYPGM